MVKRGQYKIMQMAFLILAVFIFFALIFVFFVRSQMGGIAKSYRDLERDMAISSLSVLVNSPEFSCDFTSSSWCVDKDKMMTLSKGLSDEYGDFWPVASIEILEIYPNPKSQLINCPNVGCNYYKIYENLQEESQKYSVFVNLCQQIDKEKDYCSLAKLIVGVKI